MQINHCAVLDFTAGAKWADSNPKSPWISVEDDLPCNNPNNIHFGFTNTVLVIDDENNTYILKLNDDIHTTVDISLHVATNMLKQL